MSTINPRSTYTIAKKEFTDNIRNKWVIALTIIFVILTIASSFLAGRQAEEPLAVPNLALAQMVKVDEDGRIDILEVEPGDTLIIRDELVYIASEHNSTLDITVTYIWFNSTHMGQDESQWYNSSSDLYMNFDYMIEGDHTSDYSVGDTMDITFHIIEVDTEFIKGEMFRELWDSENEVPTFVLQASVLEKEEKDSAALGGMENTVSILIGISTMLIPIIAIILGYSTISGEAESGALAVVLAYPVRRSEVLLGKFIGRGAVLVVSIVLGFGASGIIIAATAGTESVGAYLVFIGLTVLIGLLYLSLSICFSAICKKRATSLAAGVFIFFWAMIYGIIIMGIFMATGGSMSEMMTGNISYPDWLWYSMVLSPADTYQMSVMLAFGIRQMFGFAVEVPGFITLGYLVGVQLIWTLVPLILAYFVFKRRDI